MPLLDATVDEEAMVRVAVAAGHALEELRAERAA